MPSGGQKKGEGKGSYDQETIKFSCFQDWKGDEPLM